MKIRRISQGYNFTTAEATGSRTFPAPTLKVLFFVCMFSVNLCLLTSGKKSSTKEFMFIFAR